MLFLRSAIRILTAIPSSADMLKAAYSHYCLDLNFEAVTSRSRMTHKDTWFIKVWDDSDPDVEGWGECALFRGLSADDRSDYELCLSRVCRDIVALTDIESIGMSSIIFGIETALQDFRNGGMHTPWPGQWSRGETEIRINGLVWMGSLPLMMSRLEEKLSQGFKCIKLKIGGIDFQEELSMLDAVRSQFGPEKVELRLDVNGAFSPKEALHRIERLATYDIHSIEQPVRAGQIEAIKEICKYSPIPVALDEELIGTRGYDEQARLLDKIMPQYIILKPSLCGGFQASNRWISLARQRDIGWWATSAMESDIGLNAIAEWVSLFSPEMPQGLGTGGLYINNVMSPLYLEADRLGYSPSASWQMPSLQWHQ